MEKVLVSIIVVTYNAEKYIKKTIISCLNQTYNNIEVLLLDNSSGDKTVKIAKSIQLGDDRLKIFESTKNLGPYGGLNFLLEKTGGDYIAIQDHDDIWFPEKIKKQVEFLEKNSDFVACGTNTFYYYENRKVLILNKREIVTNFVDHTSLLFRNNKFRYNLDYLLADEYFEKNILKESGKIGCIQDCLTIHRIKNDDTNLSRSRFRISSKNVRDFFNINKLSLSSFSYFVHLILYKYVPTRTIWLIRSLITQRGRDWLELDEFIYQNPNMRPFL